MWQYLIFKHKNKEEVSYAIHEYISFDGKDGWTEDAITSHFESPEELRRNLQMMLDDTKNLDNIKDYE